MRIDGLKPKIILTFSLLTVALLSVMAYLAYRSARVSYERQIRQHTQTMCHLLAARLETRYLDFIQADSRNHANEYFNKILYDEMTVMNLSGAFIFDNHLQIPVSTGMEISPGDLAINRQEIERLAPGESIATLPFKAAEGLWYLWAFQRLSPRWYVGIQEDAARIAGLDRLAYSFFLIGVVGVILTILSAVVITRSLTRPIDLLSRFSSTIGQGKFDELPPPLMKGELKILRDALIRMRGALKSKQEEKEQMLAQIAHEIRNPLGGIELMTGLLKDDISNNRQLEYLNRIQNEVYGLKNQINDFLNYARPAQPNMEQVSLPELVDELELNLQTALRERNLRMEYKLEIAQVPFDRQHLKQVLQNLIANSIDASPDGGVIDISSRKNGPGLVVTVSDNGQGVPDYLRDTLFDPFITSKKEGAGLGLTICRKLCEQNRARLELAAKGQPGSSFNIIIESDKINESGHD